MKKTWTGCFVRRLLLLSAAVIFLTAFPALAKDDWELKDGSWYFYTMEEDGSNRTAWNGWVRADEDTWEYCVDGRMITGWAIAGGEWYYFNQDGKMLSNQWVGNFYLGPDGNALKSTTTPDGYQLSQYGSWMRNGSAVEELNFKTARYVAVLAEHPDAKAQFGRPGDYILDRLGLNYSCVTFKEMRLLDRRTGALLYSGDGCFNTGAVLEYLDNGTRKKTQVGYLRTNPNFTADRIYTDPAGFITYAAQAGGES